MRAFDANSFVTRHGGHKETPSIHTYEYLLPCPRPGCGSSRLRWNNRKNTFICWGCKMTGDTILLVQLLERCDELGAIEYIMDGYVGGDSKIDKLEDLIPPAQPIAHSKAPPLKPMGWPRGVDALSSPCEPHKRAWVYLESRGVKEAQVRAWRLGYGRAGRLDGFVVFPCFVDETMVYYQGRATWDPPPGSDEERKAWIKSTGYRKTLNPMSSETGNTAAEIVLNYDNARGHDHIVIVEGPFDCVKVGTHCVALLGKVMTPQKLDRLMRTNAQRYTVYLDRGEEERKAAENMAAQLSGFGEVFIATPPEGFDPGKLSRRQNADVIANAERWRSGVLTSFLRT